VEKIVKMWYIQYQNLFLGVFMQKFMLCALLLLTLPACMKRKKVTPVQQENVVSVKKTANAGAMALDKQDADALILQDDAEYDLFNEEPEVVNSSDKTSALKDQRQEEISWEEIEATADTDADAINFDFDNYAVRPDQQQKIKDNAKLVKEAVNQGATTVLVEGHSCHISKSAQYNLHISKMRAEKVKNEYVKAGVPNKVLKTVGRGDTMALTEAPKMQHVNRRVETKVLFEKNK
jgi:outer membrane protein OmpA-like peptidoglycan-associated protein